MVINIETIETQRLALRWGELLDLYEGSGCGFLSRHPGWLLVLQRAMGHRPLCLLAQAEGEQAMLPLCLVKSVLFGPFLVSLPYVNLGGPLGTVAAWGELISAAGQLADRYDVRYLELRHEESVRHPLLKASLQSKVHMRLTLPERPEELWQAIGPKVRNQIRKAEKLGLSVVWGREKYLGPFYRIFAHNMRDLGTPVFPRRLFTEILAAFAEAEIGVVYHHGRPLASGLLLHGRGVTEIPSASSLRSWNWTNANMLLYWAGLCRAIEHGQEMFDFGRSTVQSPTYRFKKQWGAVPYPAHWQYYLRRGQVGEMRPESGRFRVAVRVWRRLPVWFTRCLGPRIVRGIP